MSEETSSDSASVAFTPLNVFKVQPPTPGGAAIWCAGPTSIERLAECCVTLALAKHKGTQVYARVRVLTPPGGLSEAEIQAAVVAQVIAKAADDEGMRAAVTKFFGHRVAVTELASLDLHAVLAALPQPDEAAVATIVCDAGRYRGEPVQGGAELIWATNVTRLAQTACDAVRENGGFVLIDTGRELPSDPTAKDMLLDADGDCAFASAALDADPVAELSEKIDALVSARNFGEAIVLIDALQAPQAAKLGWKALVYLQAGMRDAALQALRASLALGLPASAAAALKFARAAAQAKDFNLASAFLTPTISRADDPEVLEGALVLADRIDDAASAANASSRLASLHPRSAALLEHRMATARKRGDLAAVADLLAGAGQDSLAIFYRDLAIELQADQPDYAAILSAQAAATPDLMSQVLSACVIDASRRGFRLDAVGLLLAHQAHVPNGGIGWLISAMREALVADYAIEPHQVLQALALVTQRVLAHLGAHPSDASTRTQLGNLLATGESGILGRFVLHAELAALAAPSPDMSRAEPVRPAVTSAQFDAFHASARVWLDNKAPLLIGQSRCPKQFINPSFHGGLLWGLVTEIETEGQHLGPPEADEDFLRYVGSVTAFAHAVDGPDQDLDIFALKLAGSQLARAGRLQTARDLIETVLQISEETPARRRAAWFAYGEVHRLAGDEEEAALGMAAALTVSTPIGLTDGWHETLDLIRVFRDLGQRARARTLIPRAAEILEALGRASDYGSRLETLRLQIEQQDILSAEAMESSRLERLIADAIANGRQVLALGEEPGPVAAILTQSLRLARRKGLVVPADADEVATALVGKLAPALAARLSKFAGDASLATLTDLADELQGARYGHNFAQDLAPLVMLARRFLAQDPLQAVGAAYAIELLADHGLLRRDEAGVERPAALPLDPEAILAIAREISTTGLGVALLGRDEGGQLVRVDVVDGGIDAPVRETQAVFSEARLAAWRQEFPKRYAKLDRNERPGKQEKQQEPPPPPPDAFEVIRRFDESLERIGVSGLPPQRVVVIPDASLTDIPVNLLPVDGAFAGESRAMASAPSLSWLARAATRRARIAGPSHCWIPTHGAPAKSLLPRVAESLKATLATAGIGLTRRAQLPAALQNAELAIVAAHGELGAIEERFFRGLADETGQVIAGDRLAHGLVGAKVAILFVCSGARLDVEPGAQAGFGLARQLLDRGCSAVIGSPWPLAGDIPERWLPAFLDAWGQGLPVIDANAFANEKVGGFANSRHALHVYGDPLVTAQVSHGAAPR